MNPQLIAIIGGSGAGKTWLAQQLQEQLDDHAGHLSLDDFYRDLSHLSPAEREAKDFDHPRSLDWPLFRARLASIRRGQSAALPTYDFTTHTRQAVARPWQPRPLVLVDGLWVLGPSDLRPHFSLSIFLECPDALRYQRRRQRDQQQRCRSAAAVRSRFEKFVTLRHVQFVAPQASMADIVLPSPPAPNQITALAQRCRQLLTTGSPL